MFKISWNRVKYEVFFAWFSDIFRIPVRDRYFNQLQKHFERNVSGYANPIFLENLTTWYFWCGGDTRGNYTIFDIPRRFGGWPKRLFRWIHFGAIAHTHSIACRGWQGFNFLENVLSACFCGLRPLEPALLPWRHFPRRISASLVALLHPSLSCASSLQLILIFLISFSTSTFFFSFGSIITTKDQHRFVSHFWSIPFFVKNLQMGWMCSFVNECYTQIYRFSLLPHRRFRMESAETASIVRKEYQKGLFIWTPYNTVKGFSCDLILSL